MKHIRMFESAEQAAAILPTLEYNTLSAIRGESGIALKPGVVPGPETIPFYIDVRGTVTLAATSGLQMSTDGKTWTDTTAMTLSSGKTYFRVASDQSTPLRPNWTEDSNSDYDIGGNINSLAKTSFANDTTCYDFNFCFRSKTKLKSAGNLILPATTLIPDCYQNMFNSCSSLTTAPELPATTLAQRCYQGMFTFTSLTTAPAILPATTLAQQCYQSMFSACKKLTTAPELPATTLAENCYTSMFQNCNALNYIKCLATDISASNCTSNWVSNVAASGTFVKNSSMTGWTTDANGIPSGWTVQDAS